MIKKYGDLISSAVILVFAGLYYAGTFGLNLRNVAGNALVPRLISYVLGACALVIFANALMKLLVDKKSKGTAEKAKAPILRETPESKDIAEVEAKADAIKSDYLKVALTLGLIAVYALLFPLLGFLVATPIYLCSQIILLMPKNKRKIWQPAVLAVVFTSAIYFLFTTAFLLVLPTGTIW